MFDQMSCTVFTWPICTGISEMVLSAVFYQRGKRLTWWMFTLKWNSFCRSQESDQVLSKQAKKDKKWEWKLGVYLLRYIVVVVTYLSSRKHGIVQKKNTSLRYETIFPFAFLFCLLKKTNVKEIIIYALLLTSFFTDLLSVCSKIC